MRSRAGRLVVGLVALASAGTAAFFLVRSEKQIADLRAAARAFDIHAREAADALADLRVAQAAYVAAGQGVGFWMPKAAETADQVAKTIAVLQSSATGADTRARLDEAASAVAEFGNVDRRARDYVRSAQPLMAADVIFTEGGETAATAARQVQSARNAELQTVDAAEAVRRRQEAVVLGAAAALVVVMMLLVVPLPRRQAAETAASGSSVEATAPGDDLLLRETSLSAAPYVTARPAGPVLKAAAQLCTDFGRVSDVEELRSLVARAADLMDASGVVIWLGTTGGAELQPVLTHGYSPQVTARLPTVPRSADNAAAAAFRTSQMQIVLARPGSTNGAIVAPLLSTAGCIGALSAEIRGGGETSDGVQALAAIFAAQLAGVLHTTPQTSEQNVTPPRMSSAGL